MSEKDLLAKIKETLIAIADHNPGWRLMLGQESLSATAVIQRLDKDKKLKKMVLTQSIALAIEMHEKGRQKLESDSGTPKV